MVGSASGCDGRDDSLRAWASVLGWNRNLWRYMKASTVHRRGGLGGAGGRVTLVVIELLSSFWWRREGGRCCSLCPSRGSQRYISLQAMAIRRLLGCLLQLGARSSSWLLMLKDARH